MGGTDANDFNISTGGVLSFKQTPDSSNPTDSNRDNVYQVTVRATETKSSNAKTGTLAVTVTVPDNVNDPPVITGDSTYYYAENRQDAVATFSATDPEGSSASFQALGGADAALFTFSQTSGELSFTSQPDFESPADADRNNRYQVTISASDGANTSTLNVTVRVTAHNEAPVISDLLNSSVQLDSGVWTYVTTVWASDPDGDRIIWSLEGVDAGLFTIGRDGVIRFRRIPDHASPADQGADNTYNITVKASDGTGLAARSDTHEYRIIVDSRSGSYTGPRITSGQGSYVVRENSSGTVGRFGATDPDGDTITWSFAVNDDYGHFDISPTGQISFKQSPDFENPQDTGSDNVYRFEVQAAATGGSVKMVVWVEVTDVNEAPDITDTQADFTLAENTATAVHDFSATDPEDDQIRWSLSGRDAGRFQIDDQGVLTFRSPPDFERPGDSGRDNVYDLTVRAWDRRFSANHAITVTVTGVDEAPDLQGATTLEVPENTNTVIADYATRDPEGEDVDLSLGGDDAGDFSLGDNGELRFSPPPDFDSPADAGTDNVYNVTITATDGSESTSLDVAVTVTNRNEAPMFTRGGVAYGYAENGTAAVETFAATDEDAGASVTLSLVGADAGDFNFNPTSGALNFASPPDFESPVDANRDNRYQVTVQARDGTNTTSRNVTVTVVNVNEGVTLTGPSTATVEEGSKGVVATFSGGDPDGADVRWGIDGADEDLFTVSDGALRFKTPPDFESPADADTNNEYQVAVEITDNESLREQAITITVTNVDEAGAFTLSSLQPVTGVLLSTTLSDPDGLSGTPTYTWARSSDKSAWTDISGATAASYTPTTADEGQYLRVSASYNDNHSNGKALSAETGYRGRAKHATNSPPEFATTSSSNNWGWTDPIGASSPGYTPTTADQGRYLRVSVSYNDDHSNGRALNAVTLSRGLAIHASNLPPRFATSPSLQAVTSRTVNENSEAGNARGRSCASVRPRRGCGGLQPRRRRQRVVHHRPADRTDPGRRRRRAGLRVG